MNRTSLTHPLYIDELPVSEGRVGLTICPGKQGKSLFGASWARDLDTDLAAIAKWRPDLVLSLIEEHEMPMLGVARLPEAMRAAGFDWHHLPIRDVSVPGREFEDRWRGLSGRVHGALEAGGHVLVHCRGGLGRAGMVAALILVERGEAPDRAIARVRSARPGAIETRQQEDWLRQRGGRPAPG